MASPWLLTGNVGTNPNADFVGTTDNQPLVIKSGSGKVGIGTETPVASLDLLDYKINGNAFPSW
jgi:hypothetical protein